MFPWGRVVAVAAAMTAVLWTALDAGIAGTPPAPPIASAGLAVLGLLFAAGAAAMHVGGRAARAPLLAGFGAACLVYALLRLTLPG